uniref:Cadherin domain-containing protein n=1 Tax=Knipowitschia caucasica TaxID=637954 RepID=A0AAV2M0G2_KNICA
MSPPLGVFTIDEKTGEVFAHKKVDREFKSCFHIKFDILDKVTKERLDKELSFDVEIQDINDNEPKFEHTKITRFIREEYEEDSDYLPVILKASDPVIQMNQISPNSTMTLLMNGCFDYDKAKSILVKESVTANDVVKGFSVDDKDNPLTPGWRAKYYFISGNDDNNYKIVTDPKTNEGVLSVVKGLNFERTTKTSIVIGVENEEKLFHCKHNKAPPPKHSTANISLTVIDTNDPPTFDKKETRVYQKEEDPPGKVLFTPVVHDIDSDVKNIRFKILDDPANWMKIDEVTGKVSTVKKMDRESHHVNKDGIYTVLVGAVDDGEPPATGTGTLYVYLKDINDNAPTLVNATMTFCSHDYNIPVKVQDLDAVPFSGPFSFAVANEKLSKVWELDPKSGPESKLKLKTENLAYGNYSLPLIIEDQQNFKSEQTMVVEYCECDETNTCIKQSRKVNLGGAAIGLILASLLLFLLLLLIFKCTSKTKFHKFSDLGRDEGNQTLIQYNQEGGSSDCKAEPSTSLTTKTTTTNNITMTDGQQTLQPAMPLYTSEEIYNMYHSSYKNNYEEEMMGTMGMHQGGMRGNYDMWTSRTGTHMSTSHSRYNLQVDQHISEHLHRKLQMLSASYNNYGGYGGGPEEDVGDLPHVYGYEGNGSKSQSLDELSLGNLDDMQFLNDLGPKFKTLGGICHQAIEEKDIHF